jgi:hypothetical protein
MKMDSRKLYTLYENWMDGNRSAVAEQLKTPLHTAQFCILLHDLCRKETIPYHYQGLLNLLEINENQIDENKPKKKERSRLSPSDRVRINEYYRTHKCSLQEAKDAIIDPTKRQTLPAIKD